jgi:hypothetical protein
MEDITRRELLSGVSATAATAVLGSILGVPPLGLAAAPEPIDGFVKLSALLTGVDDKILAPPVDPLGLKNEVFAKAQEADAATLQFMLDKLNAASTDEEKKGVLGLMMNPPVVDQQADKIRFLGRSIILAWYLGAWYDPKDLSKYSAKDRTSLNLTYRRYSPTVLIPYTILSANAYTGGIVWRVMQAHPMGYSNSQYGYWEQNPPALDLFTKNGEAPK